VPSAGQGRASLCLGGNAPHRKRGRCLDVEAPVWVIEAPKQGPQTFYRSSNTINGREPDCTILGMPEKGGLKLPGTPEKDEVPCV
jgi:hypothetical protein